MEWPLSADALALLCLLAFFAGLVDSVIGGGGLIQVPALLVFLPGAPVATIFGTNKIVSLAGTSVALARIARAVAVPWHSVLPAASVAAVFAFLGARAVSLIDPAVLKPIILVLLVAVSIHTFMRKDFGRLHQPRFAAGHERWVAVGVGVILGFYEGFFGPGTGSFLILAFVVLTGFDFLTASASAKVVNLTTNAAATAWFAWSGNILFPLAVPMALCNVAGAWVGSHLALTRGHAFLRGFFLLVLVALVGRFSWDIFARTT
ncbi:MAG TPA: TSUP family transporter [Usitatibacteraceae bacterium]|nr:TSUP family transporter [Usitatibacteraceae bacterium]